MDEARVEQQLPIGALIAPGEMALIAARAALELDEIIRNRKTSVDAISDLADLIRRSPVVEDPSVAAMMYAAFSNSSMIETAPTTVADLLKEAKEVSERLQGTGQDQNGNEAGLSKMQTFCLALSQAAAAQEQPYYYEPPDVELPELWTGACAALLAQEA